MADDCLYKAVELGDLKGVEQLLSSGNFDANTVLHVACYYGNLDVIRLLVSHGADFTVRGIHHDTPLMFLAKRFKYDCLVAIVGMFGCEPNARDSKGRSLLHFACAHGITDLLHVLVEDCKADLSDSSESPLMTAAKNNRYEIVKSLVCDYGCDPNVIGPMGRSLLHEACASGNIDLVHVLVRDCKADMNIRDHYNKVPLFMAAKDRQYEVVKLLTCEYGCDPNVKDSDGRTLLHYACVDGAIDLVHVLVRDCKAGLNVRDLSDETPFIAAVKNNVGDVVVVLNKYECDTSVRDSHGRSLLHLAGGVEVMRLLIYQFKLSPSLTDDDGNTPLHQFSHHNAGKCVRVLLFDFHAPVYIRNKAGQTPRDMTTSSEVDSIFMEYLSTHGKVTEEDYKLMQLLAAKRYSGSNFVCRLLVVGHPGAGKSSLVETLKREGFFETFTRISEKSVPPHTAGIVPTVFISKSYGRVQFYDFAGDPEYYSSHAAILERLFQSNIGTNICILVVNLAEEDAEIEKKYYYWTSFIAYSFKDLKELPSIIVIGSHSDKLSSKETARKEHYINKIIGKECVYFSLDCCSPRSTNIRFLRQSIYEISKSSESYSLSYEESILLGLLEKDFSNVAACTAQTIANSVEEVDLSLPRSVPLLYPILQQLQAIGILLVVGGKEEGSHVVLNVAQLTNEVHKKLFSKEAFLSDKSLASFNIGLLPESLLKEVLPEYITKECLIQLQYCQEVSHIDIGSDHSVSPSISDDVTTLLNKSYLFFPALCSLDKRNISWLELPELSYTIGWLARCRNPYDFFPPRFLHVLLLRIALRFTLVAYSCETSSDCSHLKRNCKMWKSGVHWLTGKGVECEVDVKESREIVVSIQSEENSKSCLAIFIEIINCVRETKAEFCHSISLEFFLLNELNSLSDDNLFPLERVERALRDYLKVVSVSGSQWMDRSKLVHLHSTIWESLFPIDELSVLKYINIDSIGDKFIQVGINLGLSSNVIKAIETSCPQNNIESYKACIEEMISIWLSSSLAHSGSEDHPHPPCWWRLVEALKATDMNKLADDITKDKGEHTALQEKLLNSQNSHLTPDKEFLESFAGVVGSKWPYLASLLSLTSSTIEEVRREGEGLTQREHALSMLQKWVSKGEASYDQLYQKLKPISIFNYH